MRKTIIITVLVLFTAGMAFAAGEQEGSGASGSEPVELIWWMPGSGEDSNYSWTTIKDNFLEENPNVKIEYALIPWSEYFTKLNAAFAGGLAPDVFGLGYGQMGPVQNNGHCLALDEYLEGWDGWDDIFDNVLAYSLKDGKHWSIMMPDIMLFFYRQDLFNEKGYAPPNTPEEILAAARDFTQTKDGNSTFIGIDVSTTNGEQDFYNAYLMFGGKSIWDENNKPTYNSPLGLKAVKYLNTFIQEGLSTYSDEHALVGGPFENGFAAMELGYSGRWVNYENKMPGKAAAKVVPGRQPMAGATFLNVYSRSKQKETAIELLKAVLSGEGQKAIYQGEGKPPTRESTMGWFKEQNKFAPVAAESLPLSRAYGQMNPYFFDFLKYLRPALEEIYYGKATPEEAFAKAEQNYLEIIK